jgi:hypothetical protein
MGEHDQHDPGPVLEGEIVFRPLDEEGRRHGGGSRRGRPRNARAYDEDFVDEVIRERLVKGRTLRDVADEYDISMETVRRWTGEQAKATEAAAAMPDVVAIRNRLALELGTIGREAWKIHAEALDNKTKLDALGRVESTVRARAILHGANAPVRHDVTVTAVSEAERELQEMINEAKAKQHADEQAVIDAASNDPDL